MLSTESPTTLEFKDDDGDEAQCDQMLEFK